MDPPGSAKSGPRPHWLQPPMLNQRYPGTVTCCGHLFQGIWGGDLQVALHYTVPPPPCRRGTCYEWRTTQNLRSVAGDYSAQRHAKEFRVHIYSACYGYLGVHSRGQRANVQRIHTDKASAFQLQAGGMLPPLGYLSVILIPRRSLQGHHHCAS